MDTPHPTEDYLTDKDFRRLEVAAFTNDERADWQKRRDKILTLTSEQRVALALVRAKADKARGLVRNLGDVGLALKIDQLIVELVHVNEQAILGDDNA